MMRDIYAEITDRIVEQLSNGVVPWRKPWVGKVNRPYNNSTGKRYYLLNALLLNHGGAYDTMYGWNKRGARILKGGKKEYIVEQWYYVQDLESKKYLDKRDPLRSEILKACKWATIARFEYKGKEYKTGSSLKWVGVFHISQTDGKVPPRYPEEPTKGSVSADEQIASAETLFKNYIARESIKFTEQDGGDNAYYRPSTDEVVVPKRDLFTDIGEFYSTVFHELTHSTGCAKRLDRHTKCRFGDDEYAQEELVAEMGSAFILNDLGIASEGTFKNSTAYIGSWLKALESDKKFVYGACAYAEKSCEFIMA